MTGQTPKERRAAHAWRVMFHVLMRSAPERGRSLARRGLTPNDARALESLSAPGGRAMSELAEEWRCDRSNVTWIVDRLERLGLAERRDAPRDRRVTLVALTPKGAQTRSDLIDEYSKPPAELLALSRSDLEALSRILSKIPLDASGEAGGSEE